MRLTFIVALLFATPVSASVDLIKMIETIRLVENSETPGRAGEQGPWQILPSVWRSYSREHISWASSKRADCVAEQKRVVTAHIEWIRSCLTNAGFADTPKNIALVWCAGFETVRRGKASKAKKDYAARAQNVYASLP
jgi:hypothetical protein